MCIFFFSKNKCKYFNNNKKDSFYKENVFGSTRIICFVSWFNFVGIDDKLFQF